MQNPLCALHVDGKMTNINSLFSFSLLRFSICSRKVIKVLTFLDVTSKKKWLSVLAEVQRREGGEELKMSHL